MKPTVLFKAVAAVFAFLSVFSATAYAQPCKDVGDLISGNTTITITGDCIVDKPTTIAGNVTIKSGGNTPRTLKRGTAGPLITVIEGAVLTLENIILDGDKNGAWADGGEGSLVAVGNGAALIMNAGAVLQNNIAPHGGGVFMKHGAKFYMNGGAISHNVANDLGGGVFVNDAGKFSMAGGAISDNAAGIIGGGVAVWGGEFTLNGGTICNNSAENGDAVYAYESAKFNNEIGEPCGNASDEAPAHKAGNAAIANLTPSRAQTGTLSAGPNPVTKSTGKVMFFYQGKQISKGELKVFNAAGKLVDKIKITDSRDDRPRSPETFDQSRRTVGEWNLKDKKGRTIADGTYLVRGTVVVDGKKERVSVMLGVR